MKYNTARFGEIDINKEDIIEILEGPVGLPDYTNFVIIEMEKELPYRTLQSLDNPIISFIIVDPLIIRTDYKIDVTPADLARIKTTSTENLEIYVVVQMNPEIDMITVNLQGPIIINRKEGLGHQFILSESKYSTKEKLILEKPIKLTPTEST